MQTPFYRVPGYRLPAPAENFFLEQSSSWRQYKVTIQFHCRVTRPVITSSGKLSPDTMAYDREVSLGFFRILVSVTVFDFDFFFFHVKMSLYYLYR